METERIGSGFVNGCFFYTTADFARPARVGTATYFLAPIEREAAAFLANQKRDAEMDSLRNEVHVLRGFRDTVLNTDTHKELERLQVLNAALVEENESLNYKLSLRNKETA